MVMLKHPDFVSQDEMFLSAGVLDFAGVSSKFSILSEVHSVEQMRAVFWGSSPMLLVHPRDKLDELLEKV